MNQQFSPEAPSLFPPGSFAVPENYGTPWQEVMRRQMDYEAAISDVKDRLVGAGLAAALLLAVTVGTSQAVHESCVSPDNLPAVVCEQNEAVREKVADIFRRVVSIPIPQEPPFVGW